jgi:D-3-phosphoglycerate dehydrogenase / 2-oxoglutarate reductase
MKILVTCPPMLGQIDRFRPLFAARGAEITCPPVVQTLSVEELKRIVPLHNGWIIGDDPATREVLQAGFQGRLRAAVKWGIGVDNVDLAAAAEMGLPITNTPLMFGREVADIAMTYVIGLARETYLIDRGVRSGGWPKPAGISLADKTTALVGFGDIGRNIAKRMLAADMKVIAYDPFYKAAPGMEAVEQGYWPKGIERADFLVLACSLTPQNCRMIDASVLAAAKPGLRVVNVSRGPLIDEAALIAALQSGQAHSAALDVMEVEPLPANSPLREFDRCIFGSHNASNTVDAVAAASERAIELLFGMLKGER